MNTPPEQPWPNVQTIQSVDHTIRLTNSTQDPIILKRNEHICHIRHITDVNQIDPNMGSESVSTVTSQDNNITPYSSQISIDPDNQLSSKIQSKFQAVNYEYDIVFNPDISKYNGSSGKIEAVVNMGPSLPPQRKGRQPHYNREQLLVLQKEFDELESLGMLA